MENSTPSLPSGQRLGPYSIVSRLGEGGMGEVYLARDNRLGRHVALKLLPPSLRKDRERLARFHHEARAASILTHPNVATIYDVGQADDIVFIAIEYVDGLTLEQKISDGSLTATDVVNIAVQVADALDAAHALGVIHRDIKSSNIMLTKREQVKVLDFGLAKIDSSTNLSVTDLPTAVKTTPGLVMGTVQYMSPEQALGKATDARSDIWSLGVVLYEMTTGRKPFRGTNASETIDKLTHTEPEAIARFNYEAPAELERIIRKCLEKDPDNRYHSARELTIDLNNLRRSLEPSRVITAHPRRIRSTLRKNLLIAASVGILLTATAAAYFLYGGFQRPQTTTQQPNHIKSIAVLPFKPLVAGSRDETLELGMADTLITKLSNLRAVDVRPISAVRRYTGLEQDAIAAGREQQVDAVLDGVIQRAGERVRVSVRFLRVADGAQLWTAEFQQNMTEIFDLQDSISERVTSGLAVTLAGRERQQLTKHHTENTEAYEFYLKGRFQINRLTDDGFIKARDYFQHAIDRDSNYALAHVALADSYMTLGGWNVITPKEAFPRAREAAKRALDLDSMLAGPHATLAMVSFAYDWDWKTAEIEFRRALDLNPNYADAHQLYGYYLTALGRFDESLAQMQRSKELDPTSISKACAIGETLNFMGRTDDALSQFQKALELDPESGFAMWSIGNVYLHKRMYDQAITYYKKAIPLSGTSPDEPATLAYAYAKSGKRQQALETISELLSSSESKYVPSSLIAATYAALGNYEEAFRKLNEAIEQRDGTLVFIKVDPIFADLRSDSRFADVLRQLNLPK